jgi:phosphoglycerate kinase
MVDKKTMKDINVSNKKCLIRVDFNVPMNINGEITDETRIQNTLPTIHNLLGRGAKIIIISHLGRPEGKDEKYSLKPVAKRVSELLGKEKIDVLDIDNPNTKEIIDKMNKGDIVFLENIRYYTEERKDYLNFGKRLSSYGDIFINDAFGAAHRIHGSTVGLAHYLPAVSGLLMEQEIKLLKLLISNPNHPFVAVIGGKKASSKLPVISILLNKADYILVGGGVANTFLKAQGFDIGNSFYEEEMLETAKKILWQAIQSRSAIILPGDIVVSKEINSAISEIYVKTLGDKIENLSIFDVGPDTSKKNKEILKNAGSILWAGPMGVFEKEEFSNGSNEILKGIAESNANSLIGGGDTIACIAGKQEMKKISHISTGGGAMLQFIENGTLPAIESLNNV